MATPVIDIQGLWRVYESAAGLTTVLRGVSLQVARGEFLTIMGPSGSGKSTLMNTLGCLDRPTAGSYKLEGVETSELADDDLAYVRSTRLGFVFQSFNLMPRSTVLRNVMLPLVYCNVPAREREVRAWKALKAVALPDEYYLHRANELSGGQMQRVAIARALIVLITHDAEVAAWGDRTVHIRDGRLLSDEQERAVQARLAAGEKDAASLAAGDDQAPGSASATAVLPGSAAKEATSL